MGFKKRQGASFAELRSCKRGTLSPDEIVALAPLAKGKHTPKMLKAIAKDVSNWYTDAYLSDGDLHLDSFHSSLLKVALLIVKGDLIVDGHYQDSDDPECLVIVTGDLKAGSMITAGWLEVHGNLVVEDALVGDYNDCSAEIFGDVRSRFLYPEEHFFKVHGSLRSQYALGNKYRLESSNPVELIDMSDERVLSILDNDLFFVEQDGDEIIDLGLEDFGELKRRIRAGESIYR
jgi:hypothetical protein